MFAPDFPGSDPNLSALVIPPRFCGPPGTGNGGYVAGRLAAAHGGPSNPIEVTLRRPAPLATPLHPCDPVEGGWALATADGTRIAEARPAMEALDREPPLRPRWDAIPDAVARADHPFPGCFVCGPGRASGDGLRLAPVSMGDGTVVAARWSPAADLAGADGHVDPAVVWAALDCPGYFAITGAGPLRPLLLGRIAADVAEPVRAGERYVVVGWPLGSEGRRHRAATALLDPGGRVRACSRQIWIEPRPS